MTTREIVRQVRSWTPFAPVALLVPVVVLPVGVLVPLAFVGLVVAALVGVGEWAGHDSLAVRRHPARQVPDGVSEWAVAQDQPVSSRRR